MTVATRGLAEGSTVEQAPEFEVRLDNFEGPFDLLLSLISKHKLDITEVSLSKVTDEFIAHVKALGSTWELEQTTSFLLVAATLLDLKAARLLPQGDVEDEEDLALLEARDLLFARLMQYRAFKQVAGVLEDRLSAESRRHPRAVGLEERFATLLPEVLIGIGLDQFAELAAGAMKPRPVLEVSLGHIHAAKVSVREQAALVVDRLRRSGTMTFRALCGDSPDTLTTVARFLSLLELFREGAVAFDQMSPLGELSVRWSGTDDERLRDRRVRGGAAARGRAPVANNLTSKESRRERADPGHRGRGPAARPRGAADGRRPAARRGHAGLGGRPPRRRGRQRPSPRSPTSTPSRAAGSSCATSPAAGASTPARSTPRWSRASSWRASRRGSPRRPSRPSPWSPTSSRCPGPGSRRSAASTSTA